MGILYVYVIIAPLLSSYFNSATKASDVTLADHPSLFPGHMEPLGARQPKEQIETLTEFPSPQAFFENYVTPPGRPLLVKAGCKVQRAYEYWNDDYIMNFPQAKAELVAVEPNLKEDREATSFNISLKKFIDRYHKEPIYMVNAVPEFLLKDVLLPPPLRCNNTIELLQNSVIWMSGGGTKSVLHNDDLDNINCLFRGSKQILLINPEKYGEHIPVERVGGYSSVDVENVNFTRYPSLRDVEYIEGSMEEGDCLFIPFKWWHQVNSIATIGKQSIAVNVWFRHEAHHKPATCDLPDHLFSLDNFHFTHDFYSEEEADDDSAFPLISLYEFTLTHTKHNRANLKTFYAILQRIPGIFVEEEIDQLTLTRDFKILTLQLFKRLNVNEDKYIDKDDFKVILSDEKMADALESWLEVHMYKMTRAIRTQLKEQVNADRDEELLKAGEEADDEFTDTAPQDESDHGIEREEL